MSAKADFKSLCYLTFVLSMFSVVYSQNQTLTPQQQLAIQSLPADQQAEVLKQFEKRSVKEDVNSAALMTDESFEGPEIDSTLLDDKNDSLLTKELEDTTEVKLERFSTKIFDNALPSAFSSTTNAVGSDYPLKAGDKVILSIWGGPEKETPLTLNNKGAVFLDNGGWVSLSGHTLKSAEAKIRRVLKKSMVGLQLGTTQIALRLEELSPIKVFVLGEVKVPGGYVFHGNTNVFAALYHAKGPNEIGSVRNVQINRGKRKYTIDLYDFLLQGKKPKQSILKDGDIVFLPTADRLVTVMGAVGREAIFELKKKEQISDVLEYAGGIKAEAAVHSIQLTRYFEDGRKDVLSLKEPKKYIGKNAEKFEIKNGDVFNIFPSAEPFKKFVTLAGEVLYPGTYEYKEGSKLWDAASMAGGFTQNVYMDWAQIYRPDSSGKFQLFRVPVKENAGPDLSPRDSIVFFNAKEMTIQMLIQVSGAVKTPDNYKFHRGMSIGDAFILAGGLAPGAMPQKVRIERLKPDTKEIDAFEVDCSKGQPGLDIKLKALDRIIVSFNPEFVGQQLVELQGALHFTGKFALAFPGETLAQFVQRNGILEDHAYPKGGVFGRLRPGTEERYTVNVDMEEAIGGGKGGDIPLRAGDSIYIPEKQISVQVYGEVVDPSDVLIESGKDAWYYINNAGGLLRTSDEDRIVIIYANGEKSRLEEAIRNPDPGSKIFVPGKPEPEPVDWVKVMGASAQVLGAIATTVVAIVSLMTIKEASSSN